MLAGINFKAFPLLIEKRRSSEANQPHQQWSNYSGKGVGNKVTEFSVRLVNMIKLKIRMVG